MLLGWAKTEFIQLIQGTSTLKVSRSDGVFPFAPCNPATGLENSQGDSRSSTGTLSDQRQKFFVDLPTQSTSTLEQNRGEFFDRVVREPQQQTHSVT